MISKTIKISIGLFILVQSSFSQVAETSELFKTLKKMDAILFEEGFTACDFSNLKTIIADDLEFYHDRGGITNSKDAFLKTLQKNICSRPESKKVTRTLIDSSLQVFPLYNNKVLYGALQKGQHTFKSKNEKGTTLADFTHLWIQKDSIWKLKRVFSYNHHSIQDTTNDEVLVSKKSYQSYIGTYTNEHLKAIVSFEHGSLRIVSEGMLIELLPKSETLFYAPNAPLTFEFLKEAKQQKLVVRENGAVVDVALKE